MKWENDWVIKWREMNEMPKHASEECRPNNSFAEICGIFGTALLCWGYFLSKSSHAVTTNEWMMIMIWLYTWLAEKITIMICSLFTVHYLSLSPTLTYGKQIFFYIISICVIILLQFLDNESSFDFCHCCNSRLNYH